MHLTAVFPYIVRNKLPESVGYVRPMQLKMNKKRILVILCLYFPPEKRTILY